MVEAVNFHINLYIIHYIDVTKVMFFFCACAQRSCVLYGEQWASRQNTLNLSVSSMLIIVFFMHAPHNEFSIYCFPKVMRTENFINIESICFLL